MDMYSHTLLILPISLGLFYVRRRQMFSNVRYCFGLGVVLLIAGTMLYWLSRRLSVNLDQNDYLSVAVFSFVIVLIGAFVLSYGTKAFRAAAFPLLFLLLIVPVPGLLLDGVVLALQKGSAEVTQ